MLRILQVRAATSSRMDRLEDAILGPCDFARETGMGNAT